MVVLLNLLFILLIFIEISFSNAEVSENDIEIILSKDGVLRKDSKIGDLNFINFGINNKIKNLKISKINQPRGVFSLKIEGLVNGNIGPNNKIYTKEKDLKSLIKIEQNGQKITNFSINNINTNNGLMTIVINGLTSSENISLKQTFKETTVNVVTRIYYENVVPPQINKSFDVKSFGPSYSYPIETMHWNINKGLEEIRVNCGIHINYTSLTSSNGKHWQYYLSTDNNDTECTPAEFFDIIKNNFKEGDYQPMENLLGENFLGYVLKREGHSEEHMDGIVHNNNNHLIEIYQKKCGKNKSKIM